MLQLTDRRLPFAARREQLVRQRQWLIELDHLLDPVEPAGSGSDIAEQVRRYLVDLLATVSATGDDFDREVATHIHRTFHNRWWGLFACYQVSGLPRTNNDLETFLRGLKTGQRRITGRKNIHDFMVRYGRFVAFLDPTESLEALRARLYQVSLDDFRCERNQLDTIQELAEKRHRFRHQRAVFLTELETRWAAVCAVALDTL